MYPAEAFNCPAYALLGNHDYQVRPVSQVEAELEYARIGTTSIGPTRWTMPSRWYRFEFPQHNPLITFIALDSNVPHPNGSSGKTPNFTLTAQEYAEQLALFETQLNAPRTTPFLVVMAHHPIYSDGPHGDHPILIHDWDPLLRKYKVPPISPVMITTYSILSSTAIPPASFFPGEGALVSLTSESIRRSVAPLHRRYTASAISRCHRSS